MLHKKRERSVYEGVPDENVESPAKRIKLSDPAVLWQGYVGAVRNINYICFTHAFSKLKGLVMI